MTELPMNGKSLTMIYDLTVALIHCLSMYVHYFKLMINFQVKKSKE